LVNRTHTPPTPTPTGTGARPCPIGPAGNNTSLFSDQSIGC